MNSNFTIRYESGFEKYYYGTYEEACNYAESDAYRLGRYTVTNDDEEE